MSEKAMAPHSSTLAWKIPWMEEPGGLQSMGSLRVRHDWVTSFSLSCIGGRNGNPLQYSCLENPRDGAACWAPVYGVALSQTRLKRLSSSSSSSSPKCTFLWSVIINFFFFLTAVITFAPSSQGHSQDVGNPQRPDILIPFLDFQESVVWCPRASIVYISYNLESARASLVSNRKESACDGGDQGSVPGLGRSPGEGMATHSSTLAWRVPWTEEPGGVQFMGWQRVRHDREPFFLSWVCHNKN